MKKILLLLQLLTIAFSLGPLAYATNFTIPAGANTAAIQATINQAAGGSGNSVIFSAGNYVITSPITIPCAAGPMNISGPVVVWPGPYTATLTSNINSWMFSVVPCSTPVTIEYLNFNGNRPSPDGGGAIYLSDGGISNFSIIYNKFWGNSASTAGANNYDTLIWLDGEVNGSTDSNDTIAWNQMGQAGDCGAIMNLYSYQGGTYDAIGGQCAAIGSHVNLTNATIANNIITQQEQGMKFYEGGSDQNDVYKYSNVNIAYNDLSYIHRIFIEAQAAGQNYSYNDVHDPVGPKWGSWGFSTPQSGATNATGNLMIENNNGVAGGPGAFEWWGNGVATGNLVQGMWGCAFQWGYFGPSQINGNTVEMPDACYVNSEEGLSSSYGPVVATNNFTTNISVHTSVAPTVSIDSTGMATISDSGPNTTAFYTTDGSTPTPYSTPYSTPFSVAKGATIQAIGMWGAINQPKSYPAGFGYIPSAVASATSTVNPVNPVGPPVTPNPPVTPPTGSTAVTLTSAYLATAGSANTLAAGATLQFSAIGSYSDGSTATIPNTTITWSSSNPAALTIASSGLATGMAAGSANVMAMIGTVSSSFWTMSVSAAPTGTPAPPVAPTPPVTPTLISAYLASTGSANTLVAGATLQFSAIGTYSDSSTATISNSSMTWSSSNPAALTIASSGLATGVATGSANVMAMIGTVSSSYWTVTVSVSKLVSVSLQSAGNGTTLVAGQTLQYTAYGTYSYGSIAKLPDSYGNTVTLWNTSNHAIAKVSTLGHVTAMGTGTVSVQATVGAIKSAVSALTVTATPPAAQANLAKSALIVAPAAPGQAVTDTFLGPFWKLLAPAGGSASVSNGHLFVAVPGGSNHDLSSPSNQSVRVVQAIGNENFDVSVKIDSDIVATDANTSQGLVVVSDDNDFITFAIETDGTKIRLSTKTVAGGVATSVLDDPDFTQYQNPVYLRLTKTGTAYVAFYSTDGANWTQATSFTDSSVPTSMGLFAGNYNNNPADTIPVMMSVNWFHTQ
jgi:hypothetical protein